MIYEVTGESIASFGESIPGSVTGSNGPGIAHGGRQAPSGRIPSQIRAAARAKYSPVAAEFPAVSPLEARNSPDGPMVGTVVLGLRSRGGQAVGGVVRLATSPT